MIFISNGPKFPKFAKGDWGGHFGGQSSPFGAYSTAITTSTPHEFTFLYRFCPQTTYNMLKRRLRGVCGARNFAKSWRLKGLKQKEKFAQKHPQNRQWRLIAQKKITGEDSTPGPLVQDPRRNFYLGLRKNQQEPSRNVKKCQ